MRPWHARPVALLDRAAARLPLPKGSFLFGVLVGVWAYNWVVTKNVLQYIGAFDFAAYRALVGALVLFLVMRLSGRPICRPPLLPMLWLGSLQTCGFMLLSNLALYHGGAGKVAVLAYTMPFWTLLFAWHWLGEKVAGLQWLALALATSGMWAVIDPGHMQGSLASKALAIGSGVCWAAATVYAKWLRPRLANVDLLSMTAWQMAFGALLLLGMSAVMPSQPVKPSPYFWFALAYSGVLASGWGWWVWMCALQKLPAGTIGLNALAVPVLAVLAAWLEQGEQPDHMEMGGMLSVGVGLLLLARHDGRRK